MFFLFPSRNIILNQSLFALLIIIIAAVYYGTMTGVSVTIGCLVALAPCMVFHKIFFTKSRQQGPNHIVKRFYWAAVSKFLLLIALFVAAAQWASLENKTFFLAFLLMQVFCWSGNLFLLRCGNIK